MRSDDDIESATTRHGDAVWRVCRMRTQSNADAQDAFQETFFSYATDATDFSDEEHRRAWLIGVATRRCADLARRNRPTEPLDAVPDQVDAHSGASPAPHEQPDAGLWEVSRAFDRLPADQREALYLTVCEGYPATEAADIMGVPVNTLYSWVARGKKRLKEVLS